MRYWLERVFTRLSEWLERIYYTWWGCRHGKHSMKMSGCVYCGKLG